ncbi:MAG: ATP-dependent Clp protease adaptor ClpS [Desulfuromonadales bacterium]|nr:ATP-dependent Clp protease adaptor ClpS [Desulfuromonadales bacterium]
MSREQTPSGETRVKSRSQISPPPLFKVLMHNDDYTTMDFVVQMLEAVFHKSPTEAHRIMLNIHVTGIGMCGTFPWEIAETKVNRVHLLARESGFPLRCSLEEA